MFVRLIERGSWAYGFGKNGLTAVGGGYRVMLGESGLGLGVRGFGFTGLGCVEGRYDSLHMLGQVPQSL